MDNIRDILVELLLAGISNRPFTGVIDNDIHYRELIYEAIKHKVASIIYRPLAENRERLYIPEKMMDELRVLVLQEGTQQEQGFEVLSMILKKFEVFGVDAIVLKGAFLRQLYPRPELRSMCDYDLLLKPNDIERAASIVKEFGYKLESDDDKHVVYIHNFIPGIELHKHLVRKSFPYLREDFESNVWKRAVPYHINSVQALTLCPQDHLTYIIVHMASHIIYGGFGLRQLCDLTLFTQTYENVIDWNKFYKTSISLHMQTFTVALFKICNMLFELKVPEIFDVPCDDDILQELMDSIFDSGVYGKPDKDHIIANMYLRFAGIKEKSSRWYRIQDFFMMIFPRAEELTDRYKYAKKYRILLPVAWLHRLVYCVIRRDLRFSIRISVL